MLFMAMIRSPPTVNVAPSIVVVVVPARSPACAAGPPLTTCWISTPYVALSPVWLAMS